MTVGKEQNPIKYKAMRFELATLSVALCNFQNDAPFTFQMSITTEVLTPLPQKYTFSERKFDEESKYGL